MRHQFWKSSSADGSQAMSNLPFIVVLSSFRCGRNWPIGCGPPPEMVIMSDTSFDHIAAMISADLASVR